MLNLQKNYLQKYQQIYPESAEWNSIQYKLQLNLGNASAYLKRVYCVVNPYMSQQFQKQNKGMIVSQVYVKPESLSASNRIERVCQKGFQMSNQKGIQFIMGQIDGIIPNQSTQYQLLVVKICPRKAFPCLSNGETESQTFCPPQGFDSIIYKEKQEDTQIYQNRFKIFKKMQTLPYYLIQFSFSKAHQKKIKSIKCQVCSDQKATVFCFTQQVYFCKNCDYEHHKDKISSKHQRNPLKDKPILDFGYCHNHKTNKNQLFCKVCNLSLCMSCKIYGDHSQGVMANHQLQKIADYYEGTTSKLQQMEPNLQKRKNQLQQLLQNVHLKIFDINQCTANIQKQLKIMFQEALNSLQAISRRKLSYLISDQLQIRRQYDYIQWMESFIKYEFNVLPPNDFLISWTKHTKLRKDVLNIANIPAISDVKPDYKIVGKVRVEVDGKIVMASSQPQDMEKLLSNFKKQINEGKEENVNLIEQQNASKINATEFRKKLLSHTILGQFLPPPA